VTVDGRSQAIALLIALCFHQALEGIGLGSTLVRAGFTLIKSSIMVLTYAVTTPIGERSKICILLIDVRNDLELPIRDCLTTDVRMGTDIRLFIAHALVQEGIYLTHSFNL